MITICNIHNYSDREKQLLPHFIRHYKDKLQTSIIFCISEQNIELQKYCDISNIEYKTFNNFDPTQILGNQDSERINQVKNKIQDWYIPVDLDEFIVVESYVDLELLQKQCVDTDAQYVTGYLVDRLSEQNQIKEYICEHTPIHEQFPHTDYITRNIMRACVYKVLLSSPDVSVSPGHHWPVIPDCDKATHLALSDIKIPIYHYKWFGNILELEYNKWKVRINRSPKYALEQHNLLNYFDAWPKN